MSKELVKAMQVLEEEKGISRQVIKEALESALALAYKKNYDQAQNVEVQFDENKGTIKVYSVKEVVETNYDSTLEISLEEALKINRAYEIGDKIKFEVTPKDFGRIATQTAKHVIMQRIREAERENIFEEFSQYVDEIMTGTVERQDHRFIYVNIGRVEAIMPLGEQIPSEQFEPDQRIKVYVAKVDKTSKGPQIVVSRAHNDFVKQVTVPKLQCVHATRISTLLGPVWAHVVNVFKLSLTNSTAKIWTSSNGMKIQLSSFKML